MELLNMDTYGKAFLLSLKGIFLLMSSWVKTFKHLPHDCVHKFNTKPKGKEVFSGGRSAHQKPAAHPPDREHNEKAFV